MTQMESPKRKMQKKNDYQRHKLFRKIKRRRKAQAEAEQQIAAKQLRKKLKIPKFENGKTIEVYTSDIHFNNDDTAGGVDRYGNKFDYIELPETVVTARKIPTFKDIEKQIGRKITQDEIDKVIAVDPEIPIQIPQPIEKGMYSPSVTNELTNTIVGTAGDAVNYLANKAGLSNLAPDEQLVETRDGDALFDMPVYAQVLKYTPRVLRNIYNKTLGNLGSAAIYANGLGFDGTVGKSFFRDPNKAYRITEFPEVEGIRESGMNVTTRDAASKVNVPANNWRLSAFDNYSHSKDGSWYKLPKSVSQYEEENPFLFVDIGNISDPTQVRLATKTGSAHGNRSQASLGKPWEGGLDTSGGLFPRGILEIQGGNKIAVGKDRVHFSLKDWEDALVGSRVGYKTGEMPLDNLTWYQRLPNGRYTMGEPVLPDKTIKYTTNLSPGYDNKMFWVTDHYNYNSGKDIHIKKSKRGTFTKAAKQHGISVQGFANKVLRNPSKYSAAMRKKANFACNASKWNKL